MQKIKSVKIKDFQIEYILLGKGEDLLFLHGGCGSFRAYEKFLYDLSKHYCIWAMSLPGAGKSSKLHRNWNFNIYPEIVYEFVKKNNIKPLIAGHSFGGAVSINAKAKYPSAFKNLILISSAGVKHKTPNRTILRVMSYPFKIILPSIYDIPKRQFLKDVVINLYYHPFDMLKIAHMFKELDLKDIMRNIDEEVLLIWGKDDKSVSTSYIKEFKRYLKDTNVYIFRGDHGFLYNQGDKIANIIKRECR